MIMINCFKFRGRITLFWFRSIRSPSHSPCLAGWRVIYKFFIPKIYRTEAEGVNLPHVWFSYESFLIIVMIKPNEMK